jgi:hypothetical protein
MHPEIFAVTARFQNKYPARGIGTQPIRQHATSRASANNDVVIRELICGLSHFYFLKFKPLQAYQLA